jgi:hypothetical protein
VDVTIHKKVGTIGVLSSVGGGEKKRIRGVSVSVS